ncbi:tRNA nucleotidyltransferase (CCA-adding enzyme) [Caldicoprobacter guelmensis]|uniref:CCA tRNA nucleotidyltransferase n=1 Tax=Caldicoprobacter guelmensis TaxID=1170224 RepID=UPI00195B4B75|nr:CCA tRNA nucleotidyltransferase [Caldicoprobacter guelmensis]MBM7582085.1 tRNA nucleotidyltransferase (CCA-adding enzyme) [Caldicoprobacter guelmensis]
MKGNINISLPKEVEIILNRIMEEGGQAYVVGGAVRDVLLGRPVKDWDIATSFHPDDIERIFSFARTIPTGKKYGTVTVVINDMPVEVTTFRGEGRYSDFRHPSKITFLSDIIEDLSRRDFTINAMAYNPYLNEPLIDPFDGYSDLSRKLIRTVGKPEHRFEEDPLRIMRGIRFCAELGFRLEENTFKAACTHHRLLSKISPERIRDELNKIMAASNPFESLMLLYETGIFEVILPELYQHLSNTGQLAFKAIKLCRPDTVLRLAALYCCIMVQPVSPLHQTANGSDFEQSAHRLADKAELVERSLKRLRYDNKTVHRVMQLTSSFPVEFSSDKAEAAYQIRKLMGNLGIEDTFHLLELKRAYLLTAGQKGESEKMAALTSMAHEILARGDALKLSQLAINGHDVMASGIGINNPQDIGKALRQAHEWVLMHPEWNDKELLLSKLKALYKQDKEK